MIDGSQAPAPSPAAEAHRILVEVETLDLDRAAIAGDYVRFDESARNALKEFRRKLLEGLAAQSRRPNNFLLWGAPGSGKSYLVQQVAASAGAKVRLFEANLARLGKGPFERRLAEVREYSGDAVCLIDEVDAHPDEPWVYELVLPELEPTELRAGRTSYCLAGSAGESFEAFKRGIRGRPKGADLLSRVPRGNEVTVPPLGVGDRILVAAAQLVAAGREERREIREIERFALYYIALHPDFSAARQLRSLAADTARRMPAGEDRVRYDYLFGAGDPENKEFWNRHAPARTQLAGTFLSVRSGTGGRPAPRTPANVAPLPPSEDHRLAILPFLNISPDPADAYFADGLTEELIATVSRFGGIRVIARTSVMRYRGGAPSAAEAARELRVDSLLEGSVRKAGEHLRVTAQLIDVATEEPRWSTTYDRRLENVFVIQEELARRIAESLHARLRPATGPSPLRPPTRNLEAYDAYLKGRQKFFLVTKEGLRSAIADFERAIGLDPEFALAYSGLAEAHAIYGNRGYGPLPEALARAEVAAQRALELDPELPEAHAALAPVLFNRYRWAETLQSLDRAIALDPSHAQAHFWRAVALGSLGRPAEGLPNAQRACELDPLNPRRRHILAQQLYWMRRYDEAISILRDPVSGDSLGAESLRAYAHLMSGRSSEAIAAARAAARDPREQRAQVTADLAAVLAYAGQKEEAMSLLASLREDPWEEPRPAGAVALVHVALEEYEDATEWYRRARAEGSIFGVSELLVDPVYTEFRNSPRYAEVLELFEFPRPSERS